MDECEFHLNPGLTRMWCRRGEQPRIPSAGQNRKVPVFGGLDAHTGKATIYLAERKRGVDFVAFLKLLLRRYAGRHVFVFLDNCSIHNSKLLQRFWADHRAELTPIWNAAYAPELNLIERYWGYLKTRATHNYFFGDEEHLRRAIREAVAAFNRSAKLRMELATLETGQSFREAA